MRVRHDPPRVITTIPVHYGPRAPWLDRAIASIVFGAAATCVVALLSIDPDPKGYDTHTQLGLSPCNWPKVYGYPCPTCGATTAATLVVHGRLLAAFETQPFGATFALAGVALGAMAGWCLLRSRSFLDVYMQLPRTAIALCAVLLLFASWGYKCLVFAPS